MKRLLTEIRIAGYIMKKNLANALGLRTAFFMQVFGMFINDFAFVIIWTFFFKAFGSINGWNAIDSVGLMAMVAFAFGIAFSFGNGARTLAQKVHEGALDGFLTRPRDLYATIITSNINISAIGDIVFGLVAGTIYAIAVHLSFGQILLMIGLIIPGALIFLNFSFIGSMIGFLLPDAQEISKHFFELIASPSHYPAGLYQGSLRFIFLFIVPALAVGGLPIEAVKNMNYLLFGFIWLQAILWTLLTYFLLHKLIKRYESGNLLGGVSS